MQESPSPNKALIAVIIIVLLAAVAAGTVYIMNNRSEEVTQPTTSSNNDTQPSPSTTETTNSDYKDGSYSATGTYTSPGGQEEVDVTLTLADGVIKDITVTTDPASGTSSQYQSEFRNNYKGLVVGKNIDEVKLSRVAGSSLTSTGFNNALDQIKNDAA